MPIASYFLTPSQPPALTISRPPLYNARQSIPGHETMIIIFGSATKGATERPLIDTHCYRCNRVATWSLYRMTEWMTAFLLPVLPVKSDRYLVCQSCKDNLQLTKDEVNGIKRLTQLADESKALHDRLVQRLEMHQFAGKTETQREYLKNRR
jgi:hypothetical protein